MKHPKHHTMVVHRVLTIYTNKIRVSFVHCQFYTPEKPFLNFCMSLSNTRGCVFALFTGAQILMKPLFFCSVHVWQHYRPLQTLPYHNMHFIDEIVTAQNLLMCGFRHSFSSTCSYEWIHVFKPFVEMKLILYSLILLTFILLSGDKKISSLLLSQW